MSELPIRRATRVLLFIAALGASAHWHTASAAVTAGNASYTYPFSVNGANFTFNVTENNDNQGNPLVSGTPRPLQLVDVQSSDQNLIVSQFHNCILVSISPQATGPLTLTYTVVDASASAPSVAIGNLTFMGSSTPSYIEAQDPSCADVQFQTAATADAGQTTMDQSVSINVLANDAPGSPDRRVILTDVEGFEISFLRTQNGSVQAQPDNSILYTPDPGFIGQDSFSYTIKDYQQPGYETLNVQAQVTVDVVSAPTGPVTPPNGPTTPGVQADITVNGGAATTVRDSDFRPGETVVLAGPASLDGTNPATHYAWFVADEQTPRADCPGATCTVVLPEGDTAISLLVADDFDHSASAAITVTVGAQQSFAALPHLTPNQGAVGHALDRLCTSLADANAQNVASLSSDQQDLLARCQGIAAADPLDQIRALDELSARDFNGARTQTLLFTNATFSGVMDRLMALRGGARGLSTAGLQINLDGNVVPVAELQRMAASLLGGAASADDEPGALLGDRWGLWTRGNFTFGDKERSAASNGFEAEQWSLVVGLDYRLSPVTVLGTALSFGSSSIDFNPRGEGGLDTDSWAVALYGSRYAGKNGYLDASLNVASVDYAANRRIIYTDGVSTVDRSAKGSTSGLALNGGFSAGYDFVMKGFTISPSGSLYYVNSSIDAFRERGGGGLDLRYDEQSFQSMTANAGLRITYAWSLPFGVMLPYVRTEYVRELKDNVEVFNVRFANEGPNAPPIAVRADVPDKSYWRLSAGFSAQLPFGLSSYLEYQRLQSFEYVTFTDLAMGLRMQYSFK